MRYFLLYLLLITIRNIIIVKGLYQSLLQPCNFKANLADSLYQLQYTQCQQTRDSATLSHCKYPQKHHGRGRLHGWFHPRTVSRTYFRSLQMFDGNYNNFATGTIGTEFQYYKPLQQLNRIVNSQIRGRVCVSMLGDRVNQDNGRGFNVQQILQSTFTKAIRWINGRKKQFRLTNMKLENSQVEDIKVSKEPTLIEDESHSISGIPYGNDFLFGKVRQVVQWSDEEKERLLKLRHEKMEWDEISLLLGRTRASCIQRYKMLLESANQVAAVNITDILKLVEQHHEDWTLIANLLNSYPETIRKEYMNHISKFKTDPWTKKEDEILFDSYFDIVRISGPEATQLSDYKTFFKSKPSAGFRLFSECTDIPWRKLSHILDRSSFDCRRRFLLIAFSMDVTKSFDTWLAGELANLVHLHLEKGKGYTEIGRSLGRTAPQCYGGFDSKPAEIYINYVHSSKSNKSILEENTRETIIQPELPPIAESNSSTMLHLQDGSNVSSRPTDSEEYLQTLRQAQPIPFNRKLKYRQWTDDDDKTLLHLVNMYGKKWKIICTHFNRTSIQCFQRYNIISNPNAITKKGWTAEQRAELFVLVSQLGPKWSEIGRRIGRTPYSCHAAYKRFVDKAPDVLVMPTRRSAKTAKNELLQIFQNQTDPAITAKFIRDDTLRDDTIDENVDNKELIAKLLESFPSLNFSSFNNSKRPWTKAEDMYVKTVVGYIGRKWSLIAEDLGRSPEDVMLRYDFKIINKAGSWTKEEDERLLSLVEELGPKWREIGSLIGRSGAQCSLRFRISLDPRLKWRLWTDDEDEQLVTLREKHQYNWAMISAVLDRASSSCRYRYMKMKRAMKNRGQATTRGQSAPRLHGG